MNLDGLRPWGGLVDGESPDVVVAGIAYDGSAVYRKGAALAPQRIRQLSAAMPPVSYNYGCYWIWQGPANWSLPIGPAPYPPEALPQASDVIHVGDETAIVPPHRLYMPVAVR